MKRTGFMYSIFAIFLAGLVLLAITQTGYSTSLYTRGDVVRIDEAYYFMESVHQDVQRAARVTSKRAFSAAVNLVSSTGAPLVSPEQEVVTGFRNGSMNGSQQALLIDASFADWRTTMQERAAAAGWGLNLSLRSAAFEPITPAAVRLTMQYNLSLVDTAAATSFDQERTRSRTVSIVNVTDPLYLLETNGRYSEPFRACSNMSHAGQVATGTEKYYSDTANWTSGDAVVLPGNGPVTGISDRASKVLIVDDVCAYSDATIQADLADFKGIVSAASGSISADGSTICGGADSSGFDAYIGGAGGATLLSNDTVAVMTDTQVWWNNIRDQTAAKCYFETTDGPTVFNRLAGRMVRNGSYSIGWGAFLFVPDIPADFQDTSRSALDYVYFNDSFYGDNHKVKGVTDHYSWFRLDQAHIDAWNMNALAYD